MSNGPISPAQAAGVRAACRENAGRLVDDARLLLKAGRFPGAFNQAYFALEEFVKARALLVLELALVDGDAIDWKDFWHKWADHSVKSVAALAMRLDDSMVRSRMMTILASPAAAALPSRAAYLRKKRENSLYVDWKPGQIIRPEDTIDEESARDLVEAAHNRCQLHDALEDLVKEDRTKARELLLHKITIYVSPEKAEPLT